MKIKIFKHGYKNGWELNLIGKVFNLRIARHQIAFWKRYNPLINLVYLFFIAFTLASCSTLKPVTHFEQPVIVITDSNFCVSGALSASINQDSLFHYLDKGVILGSEKNTVKIYWQSLGTSDPFNGQIVIEPNLCLNGSDFCLTGQYWVQVHQTAFIATIQRGITFGTPAASVFIQYTQLLNGVNGKLTVTPKVCIKTKVTSQAVRQHYGH